MEYKITSHDMNDTLLLAQNIESEKFPNMVICLNGELGTGKTVFVKGFAGALGIKDPITSPTFNIVKEYLNGELPLYHMDVYRLEDNKDNIDKYNNKSLLIGLLGGVGLTVLTVLLIVFINNKVKSRKN